MRLNYDPRRVMRALFSSILLFILSFSFSLNASGETLHPDRKQVISSQVIANLLRQYHYNHQRINDRVSSEWLDLYLDRLDRNRLYFLASDIAQFEKYRYLLDDYIRSGNMDPPFLIFNTFKVRLSQRVTFVQRQLDRGFDFSIDETYQFDRTKEPWVESVRELDEIWRKKLKNEALNLKLSGRDWPAVQKNLRKRYTNFQKRIEQYNTEDVFQLFMNALAETFDPHTSYFSPITSENFGIDMSLSFEGIGAQLTTEDDYTKVVRILPGGPADRSKQLWANDKIVGVAQGEHGEMVDVIGMRLDDVVQKIRGPKGTVVRLEVIPAGSPAGSPTKEISLVRDKVILEERAAKSDTIELVHEGRKYKIGVIDVPAFYVDLEAQRRGDDNYKSTTRDVKRLLRELQRAGVDGIIIDLRRNGGGSLQEAIEMSGLFIKDGPVVQVRNSVGSKRVEYDPDPDIFYDGPLAVLVDRASASASEIFAAAIQDYGRGIIVGSQTFGKGTVQNLLSLDRFIKSGSLGTRVNQNDKFGQLKVTIAKFYRVTGGTTQNRGVIPDIRFPSVYEMDFGESTELHALPWDEISPALFKPIDQVSPYVAKLRMKSQKRTAHDPEFQYLLEDIQHYKDSKSLTLNERKRKAERERLEAKRLRRINERRHRKGLKPLPKGAKIPSDEEAPDAFLRETERILADYISLSNPNGGTELAKTEKGRRATPEAKSQTVKVKEN